MSGTIAISQPSKNDKEDNSLIVSTTTPGRYGQIVLTSSGGEVGASASEGGTAGTATGNIVFFKGVLGTYTAVGTGNGLPVTLQTLISGEDLTANRLMVETRNTGSYLTAAGTYTLKGTASGVLHAYNIGLTTAAPGTFYDSVNGTNATPIYSHKTSMAENSYLIDISFTNGLVYATPGTPTLTVSFR